MSIQQEFSVASNDGIHTLHAVRWLPDGEPKGIICMVHGMCEYILRYREMADWFAGKGFIFAGADHLGHGQSVKSPDELGFFAEHEPERILVEDIHSVRRALEAEYPGLPVILIGHSMGSFLARDYVTVHASGLAAAVFLGGNDTGDAMSKAGGAFIRLQARIHGWRYRSGMVKNMVMGSYTKRLNQGESPNAWISKRKEIVDAYDKDPLCTYNFTLNGFYALTAMALWARRRDAVVAIPKELPILIMSGTEDPVGEYGVGVKRMAELYRQAGIRRVEMVLKEGNRHELHNEEDRGETFETILSFILGTLEAAK